MTSNANTTFESFLNNWVPPVLETQAEVNNPITIKEGDILVAQWGYEANNVNYFKVLKRTKTFVEVAELDADTLPGNTGIYDGVYVVPGTTWKNYSLWADRESYNMSRRDDGQPIVFKRKVKTHADGGEYVNLCEYAHMNLWSGRPLVDYNHH